MSETLSKRLSKVCGIEPIKSCENCSHPCEVACNNCSYSELVYPDFENAENYIRLEEIMLTELAKHHLTVVKWVHYWSDNTLMHEYILITKTGHKIRFKHNDIQVDNWFVERENRTDCLILFILWKVIPICGESIKQAIRETDWEY